MNKKLSKINQLEQNNLEISSLIRRKTIKGIVIGSIFGIILAGSIGVAAVTLTAKEVSFSPSDSEFNVNNVEGAINELYNIAVENSQSAINWQSKTWNTGSTSISVTSGKTYLVYAGTVGWRSANISFTSGGSLLTSKGQLFVYADPAAGDEFTYSGVYVIKATSNTLKFTVTNSGGSYARTSIFYMQLD